MDDVKSQSSGSEQPQGNTMTPRGSISEVSEKHFDEESRSVYVGHVPDSANFYDLCKAAHPFGQLEMVRMVPRKKCAFLNFIELESAKRMLEHYPESCVPKPDESQSEKTLFIQNKPVRLSWSKTHPLSDKIVKHLEEDEATRNLFVFYGGAMEQQQQQQQADSQGLFRRYTSPMTSTEIAEVFREFGNIENIVLKPKKYIAFVNMTSISSAVAAVEKASSEEGIALRSGKLVVKYSHANDNNYTSSRNDPRNQPFLYETSAFRKPRFGQRGVGARGAPLQPPFDPPLPNGWQSAFDENSGMRYYYNVFQGISQWEHPVSGKRSVPGAPATNAGFAQRFQASAATSRALIFQGLPSDATYAQICALARPFGLIESVRLHEDKNIAFVNFVDSESASNVMSQQSRIPFAVGGTPLRVAWAKDVPIKSHVYQAIVGEGASRSLYLRDITETVSEQDIRDALLELSPGVIESVILMPNGKPFGFVNFTDIASAKKVVDSLQPNQGKMTINGEEVHISYVNLTNKLQRRTQRLDITRSRQDDRGGCRSVIISNFPQGTTLQDIARLGSSFGAIESLHLSEEKNHAFINYLNPVSAEQFMAQGMHSLHGESLRVGFGKSVPLRSDLVFAVQNDGASRNLYIGGIDAESDDEAEKVLKSFLDEYTHGVYESISVNLEKKFAFVNLANIHTAKKIVDFTRDGASIDGVPVKVSYARSK